MVGVRLTRLSWRPLGATHRGPRKENIMTDYILRTQEDYEQLDREVISFMDNIFIQGDIDLDHSIGEWDIYIRSGNVSAPSSLRSWLTLDGGTLTLVWDGDYQVDIGGYERRHSVVILDGWPDDRVPEDEPSIGVSFIRKGTPVATITYGDGRTETEGGLDLQVAPVGAFDDPGETPEVAASRPPVEEVVSPVHYTWIGQAIVSSGGPERTEDLESWDILDALFPDDPHLWNAGKYLTRLGRKGSVVRRIVDLRKARTYLDRAIRREERDT